jgi:hypothetical protein
MGHAVAEVLWHKQDGQYSITNDLSGCFNRRNPSSRTVAVESTQPVTEFCTRNVPVGIGWPTGA